MRDIRAPSDPGWVRAERVLLAPVKPAAAWAVVLAHAPFNEPGAMGPDAVIARLAAFLNARPAAPQVAVSCPALSASYQLRFTAKKNNPVLTVSDGCLTDQITVNGVPQPLVWDNDGGLGKLIRSLLGR
jgi:hypothetical protein